MMPGGARIRLAIVIAIYCSLLRGNVKGVVWRREFRLPIFGVLVQQCKH